MLNYAFTVKNNDESTRTHECYKRWLDHAETLGVKIQQVFYEYDNNNRLHIHGVLQAPKNFYKSKLMYNGYHQRIDVLGTDEDLQRFLRYAQKDQNALNLKKQIQDTAFLDGILNVNMSRPSGSHNNNVN